MHPRYRPGDVAELAGVSVDTVRRWCDSGQLPSHRRGGGRREIDGGDLARFLAESAPAAGPEVVGGRSGRHRFTGIVTRVVRGDVAAQVEIHAGPHRVVSLLTAEAVEELGLEPGVLAVASVKATNVVVELPEGR